MGFFRDLERGKIGEEIFIKQAKRYFGTVMDFRGTQIEKDFDVDFAVPWSNYYDNYYMDWLKVEVKTDYQAHKTGNLCFEYTSAEKDNYVGEGCFMKTDADLILYYLYETNYVYAMHPDILKTFVLDNKEKWISRRNDKHGLLYLVPLKILVENGIAKKINFKCTNVFRTLMA